MQKMDNTTEHASAEDFFKFLGVLVSFIFTALFFFLKLLGDSKSSEENSNPFGVPENDYNNLSSGSLKAMSNPNNLNHDD